ncbi:YcdB/YcdC domain-containing protein [Psychrobacillus sp.]|uniref:YcdB/YcdC domain-containing protein n=1 Tax=Psychrobacillus sp. TaxID=1871623 RepID=UPI0028BE94BE|nr:YcdB/YcdC domain-containing protein [Psychrobacillus sp.]
MFNYKKIGVVLTSSALSLGMFSSMANASTTMNIQPEKVQIQVSSTEKSFTKNDLIKKLQNLFPKKFDFLSNSDFNMNSGGRFFPDDDTMRYDLFFHKTVNGKQLNGSATFVGEKLDIEQFYLQPPIEKESLFPAKVTKDDARKIANDFVKKLLGGAEYQLETDPFNYLPSQILSEPIRYSFSFARTKNQVSIKDQRIEVSVLGNGEIVSFSQNPIPKKAFTFDDAKQLKDKEAILEKVKENLSVDMQYQINNDYRSGDRSVQLVYLPTTKLLGVNASTGQWITTDGDSAEFPKNTKIEMISAKQLPPKQKGITLEQAKKIAEQMLKVKSDKVKLNIESVEETKDHNGQEVIRIQYMYQYANGGSGTVLELDKKTGEIVQYNDMSSDLLERTEEESKKENPISEKDARTQAIKYLKELAPSYLHNYAMPVEKAYLEERFGTYSFSFPRIVNGIVVMGDQLNVSIGVDGSLKNLNINYQEIEKWPSIDKAISKEDAKVILKKTLSLNLNYMKSDNKKDNLHYDLVYLPSYNEDPLSFLDANSGEWSSLYNGKSTSTISHPWAAEELNYLINAEVLDMKDTKNFNGDASVSKGEALKVMMNSLTYFYSNSYDNEMENKKQTIKNIDPKHPLYQVVERAVDAGIINADNENFDFDSPIKKEELAVWYIRALGLDQAARNSNIYKLDFADANKVKPEYAGYVALATSMGLLKTDQNNFYPDREATYAELAVSVILLAHELSERGNSLRNY